MPGCAFQERPVSRCGLAGGSRGGVESYYGVRYARLSDPRRKQSPAVAATGQFDAGRLSDVAIFPQLPSRLETVTGPAGRVNPQDDEAFFLNIWTPADAGNVPVLVFLHGGAWASGGGSVAWYRGERLACEGIVVVTLNYRLGPAGHLDDDEPGSYHRPFGDIALALNWVKTNIAAFGGDPDRITLGGQSAGAWYAWALAGMPQFAGLFGKAALLSIPRIIPWTPEYRTDFTRRALAACGSLPQTHDRLLKSCAQVLAGTPRTAGAMPPMYLPVASGELAGRLSDPRGNRLHTDALYLRVTDHEMSVFLPPDADARTLEALRARAGGSAPVFPAPGWDAGRAELVSLASRLAFHDFARQIGDAAAARGSTVLHRRYRVLSGDPHQGAVHCIDLPFQFGNLDDWVDAPMLNGWDRDEFEALSRTTRADLADFVKGSAMPMELVIGSPGMDA